MYILCNYCTVTKVKLANLNKFEFFDFAKILGGRYVPLANQRECFVVTMIIDFALQFLQFQHYIVGAEKRLTGLLMHFGRVTC